MTGSYSDPGVATGRQTDTRDAQVEAARQRLHGIEAAHARVDLRRADPRLFLLPQRSPVAGLAQAAWDRAFGQELTIEPFEFPGILPEVRLLRRHAKAPFVPSGPFETSRNWAGAYITANQGRHLAQIWGFWTIPATLTVPPPPFGGDPALPYLAVNWIGLDGQRDYLNSSLPQIGTQATLDPVSGDVTAFAWIQWWASDDVNTLGPVTLNIAVKPNDVIGAVLTVVTPQLVWGAMVNLTSGHVLPLKIMGAPTVKLPSGALVQPLVEGATAEWIVERSEVLHEHKQNNLPDYGETGFEFCVAVEAWEANALSVLDGIARDLSGARYIRMYDVLADPPRTAILSMPRKVNDLTLRVRYGGFPKP